MNQPQRYFSIAVYLLSVIGWLGMTHVFPSYIHAQQPIGGPYQPDSATVVLMHFNESLTNDNADRYQIAPPEEYGRVWFTELPGAGKLGKQIRFDNFSPDYKSHLQIPDTAALDLTGSWTIEMWLNHCCYSRVTIEETPELLLKPVLPLQRESIDTLRSNYIISATRHRFRTGYYSETRQKQRFINTYDNIVRFGEWYHLTLIRDTARQLIATAVHQNAADPGRLPNANGDSLKLIFFKTTSYGNGGRQDVPITSDQPLFVGHNPFQDTAYKNSFNGYMDELRISNRVRNFPMPPAITEVAQLNNQPSTEQYTIEAHIQMLAENQLASAHLHYKVDHNRWKRIQMSKMQGHQFTADIPSQPIGSRVRYRVTAQSKNGRQASKPVIAEGDTAAFSFNVWDRRSQVLHLNFNKAEEGKPPEDQSRYENAFSIHGNPRYPEIEGMGQVLHFSPADSTAMLSDSDFLSLPRFAIELKFQALDSLPDYGNLILNKQDRKSNHASNYKIGFASGGQVWTRATIPGVDWAQVLPPKWTITDTSISVETWYRLQFAYQPDTVRARLYSLSDSTYIGGYTHSLSGDRFAQTNDGPLVIGGIYPPQEVRFNGRIDDVKIYNYIPQRFQTTYTSATDQKQIPRRVELYQNYPNPFNPTTKIRYSLPRSTRVKITVYDLLGRRVITLVEGKRQAGKHFVTFDASNLSSGVYIYRLKTEEFSKSRKMLLVK